MFFIFSLCKAEQSLQGMNSQEREEENEEKYIGEMIVSVNPKQKNNGLVLKFCVFFEVFHHTRVQDQISTPSNLSVVS